MPGATTRWLDARVLSAACAGDAEILERIVRVLRAHIPKEWARVDAGWRARDPAGLREAAHRLCGMVATASSSVGQVASDLEDAAAANDFAEADALFQLLGSMIEALLRELEVVSIDSLVREDVAEVVSQ